MNQCFRFERLQVHKKYQEKIQVRINLSNRMIVLIVIQSSLSNITNKAQDIKEKRSITSSMEEGNSFIRMEGFTTANG